MWCLKRGRRLEDHSQAPAIGIKGFDVIGEFFIFATMGIIFGAVLQQHAVQLLDVVFGNGNVIERLKYSVHRLGITSNLFLIPGTERAHLEVSQEHLDLLI